VNRLELLNARKAAERGQLADVNAPAPPLEQFWIQPNGARLVLIEGDQLSNVPRYVQPRGETPSSVHIGSITAYPAHLGTLLSRRRKGNYSTAMATWSSNGWTKVQETRGGCISDDEQQLSVIARALHARVVGVVYDEFNGSIGLIESRADGVIIGNTYLTPVLIQPRGNIWHAAIVSDPTPNGLTKALVGLGFDPQLHLTAKCEMQTVVSCF
jgi:hypothetical protein